MAAKGCKLIVGEWLIWCAMGVMNGVYSTGWLKQTVQPSGVLRRDKRRLCFNHNCAYHPILTKA